ncbi:MAG: TolB family protein [Candidatus Methanospirareceae archaeon]
MNAKTKKILTIVLLLTVSLSLILFYLQSRPMNDLTYRYDVTRLTTDSAGNVDPVWSRDGSKIFFESSPHIYIMDPDGGNVKKLTRGTYPALSRDGSRIFFRRIAEEERELWVMNLDGSDEKRVVALHVTDDQPLLGPGWGYLSPDGSKVCYYTQYQTGKTAYNKHEIAADIRMTDVNGGNETTIVSGISHTDFYNPELIWSPDGQKILFQASRVCSNELTAVGIRVVDIDNTNTEKLSAETGENFGAEWSPDGRKIVYISDHEAAGQEDNVDIRIVNLGDGSSEQLTESPTFKTDLDWSPDGNRIAYISRSTKTYCYSGKKKKNDDKSEIWVMNSDGGDKDLLLSIPYNYGMMHDMRWSPDGSRITFVWAPNVKFGWEKTDIYMIDVPAMAADGGGEIKRPTETSPPTSEVYQTPDNLTDESLAIGIPDRLTGEERSIVQIALKNRTVQEMMKGKEINISSVSRISGGEPDEYGKESSYDFPGVQMYIGNKDWTGIIEIIPLVDLKERKVVRILKNTFIKPALPADLTENEESNAIRIALDNPQVKEKIADRDYEIITVMDFENWMTGKRVGPTQVLIHVNGTGMAYSITVNATENEVTEVAEPIWLE